MQAAMQLFESSKTLHTPMVWVPCTEGIRVQDFQRVCASDWQTQMLVIDVEDAHWQTQDLSWRMYYDMDNLTPAGTRMLPIVARLQTSATTFEQQHQALVDLCQWLDIQVDWETIFGEGASETGYERFCPLDSSCVPREDRCLYRSAGRSFVGYIGLVVPTAYKVTNTVLRRVKQYFESSRQDILSHVTRGWADVQHVVEDKNFLVLQGEADSRFRRLRDVMILPGIDANRCTSNNLHEICEVLGIEAARTRLYQLLDQVLSGKVNPRHLDTIVNIMTRRGDGITPFTRYSGDARRDPPIKRMGLEQTFKIMSQAAWFGETDFLTDPVACQVTGAPPPLGTRFFGVRIDREMLKNGRPMPMRSKEEKGAFADMYKMCDVVSETADTSSLTLDTAQPTVNVYSPSYQSIDQYTLDDVEMRT